MTANKTPEGSSDSGAAIHVGMYVRAQKSDHTRINATTTRMIATVMNEMISASTTLPLSID